MEKKKIGLVVAIEMDAVLKKYGTPLRIDQKAGFTVHVYETGNSILYAADAGAGEINAANTTQYLICTYGVDLIINFGVAGALEDGIKTAQLCVISNVIHYDFDTTGWLNLERGRYPSQPSAYIPATAELVALAESISEDLRVVSCASADKFVDDEQSKRALHQMYRSSICEMEAAGVLLTSSRNGIPCLLIKAVSDSLTGGGKEFMTELDRISRLCFDLVDRIISCL